MAHTIQSVHHRIVLAISFLLAAPHAARNAYTAVSDSTIIFTTPIIIVFRSFRRSGRTVSASRLSSSFCVDHKYHHPLSGFLYGRRDHRRCLCRFCMFYFPFSTSILNNSFRRSPGTAAWYGSSQIVSVLSFSETDLLRGICALLPILHGDILRTSVLSFHILPISSGHRCRRRYDDLLSVACCHRDSRYQADLREECFSCVSFVFSLFRISEIIILPDPLCFLSLGEVYRYLPRCVVYGF